MFQFLIGFLQTKYIEKLAKDLEAFQFLIGFLQTVSGGLEDIGGWRVSIPYRFSTNA